MTGSPHHVRCMISSEFLARAVRVTVAGATPACQSLTLRSRRAPTLMSNDHRRVVAVPLDEQVRPASHLDRGRLTMSSTRWGLSSETQDLRGSSITKIWPTFGLSAGALEGSGRLSAP